jgi:hypothetical protein
MHPELIEMNSVRGIMPQALSRKCPRCRHEIAYHAAPTGNGVYWRCRFWIGHPWDDYCECRDDQVLDARERAAFAIVERESLANRRALGEHLDRTRSSEGFVRPHPDAWEVH